MHKPVAAFILALVSLSSSHAEAPRDWAMSGAELVQALQGKRIGQFHDAELQRQFSSAYAQAYLLGVADLTRGTAWCLKSGILPHELADRVYTWLSAQTPERLRGNAAPLVSEALKTALPCDGRGF